MKVSVVIPAFNEAPTLGELLRRVQAVDLRPLEREIIVVDNNSTDDTHTIASGFPDVRVIRETTQGKGAAVRAGFKAATGDIFLIQDADLEYDPQDYPNLIRFIVEEGADAVIGIRTRGGKEARSRSSVFYGLGNFAITLATNLLYGGTAAEYTGGYKLFRRPVIESLVVRTSDFAYEHELICKVLKKKYRVIDTPIRYYPRDYAGGKKINWRDGFKILWAVIKYRFID